jgi:polysaccharide export outer membrane protein
MNIRITFFLSIILLASSCSPTRNLAYFSDLQEQEIYKETIGNSTGPIIQEDDLLSITVNSLNPEANSLFNRGTMQQAGTVTDFSISRPNNIHQEGYLVDKDGYIEYPVIGKLKLAGLTKEEAKNCLVSELQEYLKDPIVNIRYLNYKISVIGEVNRPSTFTIPSERINLLEALGMAGDMTAFGKRENVLIIREDRGVRTMTRVNLNSKELLNSPFFYLKQNDVVYVEPDKIRQVQASTNTRNLALFSTASTLIIIIVSRFF